MKTKLSGILTLLLAFVVQISFAQERTITGTVSDESGPLPGVSILIQGTNSGTETDFDGNYSIDANSGDVLQFSFVGMTTVSKTVGAEGTINVTMVSEDNTLDEVVVTALGITREKKSLGYATQEVDGEQVNTVKETNFVNSLSGKVAGIDVKTSGTMGGSTNVVIRGYASLFGNNQALFVVDGVPVSNSTYNSSGQRTGRGGYDYGNAAQDINPDDIETVNVLKGGAATALYGSRAANGVIVITTKKGRAREDQAIGVTINSTITFNKLNKDTFVKYQREYGAGYGPYYGSTGYFFDVDFNGDGQTELATVSSEDASFGAAFDENLNVVQWQSWYPQLDELGLATYGEATPWLPMENDPSTFYETGTTLFNTVTLDGANDQGQFKLGYTNTNVQGILPNSEIQRHNFDFSGSWKFTEKFTASTQIAYNRTNGKGRFGTGYDANNVNQSFRQWFQTNVDIQEQKEAYFATGDNITWNPAYPTSLAPQYFDNPYWVRYENFQDDERNRIFGNISLNYEINDWLSVMGRATIDHYTNFQQERTAVGSVNIPNYNRYNNSYMENNYDLMLNFNKQWDKWSLRGVLGTNILRRDFSSIFASTNGGLNVPGLYSLSNSKNPINAPTESAYSVGVDGYYANASIGFNNILFVDASYRRDKASTLPRDNDEYDYYGFSGSFLFSSLFDSNVIDLGKIRAGYAKTGNFAAPLTVYNTYGLGTPIGGQGTASLPASNQNQDLKNEITNETEIGLEMSMWKNRLGFDFSVYDKTSEDLITPVSISTATGYNRQWLNAGEVQNKGIELSLYGSPIRTDNFEWRIDVNWGKNESKVISLPQGLENLQLASLQGGVTINAAIGEPYGTIKGSDFIYTDGQKTIDPTTGRYLKTADRNQVLGTFQPEWRGGINNRFTWKDITLSFLIDMQKGGSYFSLDRWYGSATGTYDYTAGLNENGIPKRDPVSAGGGILLEGVNPDGSVNTTRTRMDYYANALGYARAPNALHVYDAGFIKLREFSLGYNLPTKYFSKGFVKGLSFTLIGRNLWIIDKDDEYSDPEAGLSAGNIQGYQSGAYPSTKDYGFSVKLQF
jgi:TonB-linked SusC/RagA family outer membrane protein